MQSKINLYKLILILSFPLLMAFTPESDSLLSRYKKETQPPKKLQYLLHFCAAFKTYPVDTLKKYATEAVSLSLSQKDNASIADAYTYLARAFLNLNNLDSAIWACDKIDKYALNTNKPSLAKNKADLMRGTIFTRKGQHDKAIA